MHITDTLHPYCLLPLYPTTDVDLLAAALQGPDELSSSQLQQLQQRLAAGNSDLADMQVDWGCLDTNATVAASDAAYAGPGLNAAAAAAAAAAGNSSFHSIPAHEGQNFPQSPFVAASGAGSTALSPTDRQQQFMPAHSGPDAEMAGPGAGSYYEAQSAGLLTPWVHNPEPLPPNSSNQNHLVQQQQHLMQQQVAQEQQQLVHQAAQQQQAAPQLAGTTLELNRSVPSLGRDLALLKVSSCRK